MTAGTLSAETLTKAYLARIALTNAEGPALQAVRALNTRRGRRGEAARPRARDERRARPAARHPGAARRRRSTSHGLPTTAGSIALQKSMPRRRRGAGRQAQGGGRDHPRQDQRHRAQRPARRQRAGGLLVARRPGAAAVGHRQDARPARRPAAPAATAEGLAALTVGLETSTDTAQIIAPAGVAGVVALKPTVGLVSTDGVLPRRQVAGRGRARSPRTVADAAAGLGGADRQARTPSLPGGAGRQAVGGRRHDRAPSRPRSPRSRRSARPTVTKTAGTPSPNPPSIINRAFEKDLNAYLARHLRRRGLAAGHRQLQHREPGRGPQVPAGPAGRRALRRTSSALRGRHSPRARPSNAAVIDALLADTDVIIVPSRQRARRASPTAPATRC